jgi:hypothetical protein
LLINEQKDAMSRVSPRRRHDVVALTHRHRRRVSHRGDLGEHGDTAAVATGSSIVFTGSSGTSSCASPAIGGTTGTSPFTGSLWTAFTGTLLSSACTTGASTYTMQCQVAMTATQLATTTTLGTLTTTCVRSLDSCTLRGTLPVLYYNPSGSNGRFTVPSASGLLATNTCTGIGVGTVSTSEVSLTVTSAFGGPAPHTGPVFLRTP